MASDTAYDTSSGTGAVLANDPTATQVGAGSFQPDERPDFRRRLDHLARASFGVTVNTDGSLSFDEPSTYSGAYASNPDAVKQFFTDPTNGFAVRLDNLMTQVAGSTNPHCQGNTSRCQASSATTPTRSTR